MLLLQKEDLSIDEQLEKELAKSSGNEAKNKEIILDPTESNKTEDLTIITRTIEVKEIIN